MKTAVMTDSNSGITPEEGKKIGIYSLPMPVIIEGDVFYEGKNITVQTKQIEDALPAFKKLAEEYK